MANNTVTSVYRFVIDDVITNVRRDFEDMGVDETIMQELQRSWENKIAQSRVTSFQAPETAGGTETYPFEEPTFEQPAAALAQPPQHHQQQQHAQPQPALALPPVAFPPPLLPPANQARGGVGAGVRAPGPTIPNVSAHVSHPHASPIPPANYNYRGEQTAAANLANVASATLPVGGDQGNNMGRPQPHAPPRKNHNNNNNINNISIPQTDGPSDSINFMTTAELDAYVEKRLQEDQESQDSSEVIFTLTLSDRAARRAKRDSLGGFFGQIGQVDGDAEDDDDEDGGEGGNGGGGGGDDADLGSDLDDSDGEIDEESDNIVLCQYDKVTRTKNKWKCVLKDGIMLINGRDYLFHKATGDFEW
ncbi:transcription factor IIA subunit alpha [Gryganskiella cystojenkinii]|nr:transcription factor IIA subunit alpha [Gryganskiella cystojenkinii]